MYNSKLWETSGHWQNYKDDMFTLDIEKEKWALKPMNCPGHCLLFKHAAGKLSLRDLPVRYADFSPLHRYGPTELSSPGLNNNLHHEIREAFERGIFH